MKQIGRRCNKLYIRLGIDRDASQEEIKMAYRNKAKTFHPDVGGDKDSFHEIVEAYQVLSDPKKRLKYDQTGDYEKSGISEQTRIEQSANDIIAVYFQSLCSEKKEQIIFMNIVVAIKEKLKHDILNAKNELKKVESGLKFIDDLLGRIEYKGKTVNVMEGLVLKFMEEHENAIQRYKDEITDREAALKLLKNYKFNPKIRQAQYTTLRFTSTNSTSW